MKKDDIELPPLPLTSFHARRPYETEFTPNYSVGHMRQYARAAIEPYQLRIFELEAQLDAIGAGGVSGQRITSDRQRSDAKKRYDEAMDGCEERDPIERLRFFCSLAMSGQDWLDSEQFFDDVISDRQQRRGEPVAWPECPPRRQSHVLFDDGYEEGWAKCLEMCKEVFHELLAPQPAERSRGEPVAWQWLDTAHFRKKIPSHSNAEEWRPLFTAPQPAEPVKGPSDAEIKNIARELHLTGKMYWMGFETDENGEYTQPVISNAELILIRAVLARYGNTSPTPPTQENES